MTRTTPDLAPPSPKLRATSASTYEPRQIWSVSGPQTQRLFSGIGFRTWSPLTPGRDLHFRKHYSSDSSVPEENFFDLGSEIIKEAITKGDPSFLPNPLSYLKSEIRSATLSIWQDNWNNVETGRSTHDIVPRVPKRPVEWNREELMFVTGQGPFPSFLHRFNLRTHDNCSYGEKGDPMHYATKCRFALS
ncbi:hypothetical protein AVEN_261081-1 [Araneus ventricosus]|uniref:Uncharacterized protein n=1 Tax=Araneus ventricosus TaxID=182803 RepID=A0A4Y2L5C0_ARAVE|nr:hypothetical protein AVEN_261081-1 [Araneus ventricosus]